MKQPPIQKSGGLSSSLLSQHCSLSPSSFHTSSSDSITAAEQNSSEQYQHKLPLSSQKEERGSSYAAEDASFCCDADEYVDLRSGSRSRASSRDVRKKSKSSQVQYLTKQVFASSSSPSTRDGDWQSDEAVKYLEESSISKPRKREDRRREDSLAASLSAIAGSRAANESRMTTSQDSNSDPYWPSAPILAAAGKCTGYGNNWKQQQRQERRGRLEGGT